MNLFLLNISDWFNDLYNKYQPMFDQFFMGMIAFVPKFIGALLLLFLGWFLGRMISRFFQKLFERIGADKLGDRLNQIVHCTFAREAQTFYHDWEVLVLPDLYFLFYGRHRYARHHGSIGDD